MTTKCKQCGHEVTCYHTDIGGASENRDLYFYVCQHCGNCQSDEIYAGQTAGTDEITYCTFCGDSCLNHRKSTNEIWQQFQDYKAKLEQKQKDKPAE